MRRGYIDWLRGVAVLIMVEAHTSDAWIQAPDRASTAFGLLGILGGFGAPLFLFLAGVAVPLSIAAKVRKGGAPPAASRAVQRRGWEIFGLAVLFRLQAKLLGGGGWRSLLKVDILNIMGPGIALAAILAGLRASVRARFAILAFATAAIPLATPLVRAAAWPASLPDFIEAYIRPMGALSNFTLFPWLAFLLGGACVGLVLAPVRDASTERRVNLWCAGVGTTLIVLGWAGSYLPSPYAASYFWTSSPAFFAMRLGILLLALGLAFALRTRRPSAIAQGARAGQHPIEQLGRTSLFLYWIHVEMVYGQVSRAIHRQLTIAEWAAAFVAFTVFLWGLSVIKTRIAARLAGSAQPEIRPART